MQSIQLKRSIKSSRVLLCFLVYIVSCCPPLFGQGDLLVTPRRVIFEGSRRSVDLNLANTGKDTATYAISLIQIRMTEDGAFETITEPDPGQQFADRHLRFFPRQVTLGPNEAQVVKVQLLRPAELKPGEYRSHFYFRAVPKPVPLGEQVAVKDESSISVVLTPVYGITIPAIIRVGEPSVRITLTDLALTMTDTIPQFSMTFNRTGNMSAFGDLTVYHISPQGKETRVGIANGIAIYTPNTTRKFRFSLNRIPGVDYSSGTLRAIFSAPTDVRPERYAEAEVSLQR